MKEFISRYIKICPKTGRFRGFRPVKGFSRIILPLMGFIALLWIVFRVISKPSRINYPCVKAAMPFAAGFIQNLIVFIISAFAFSRIKSPVFKNHFILAALLVTFTIGGNYFTDSAGRITFQNPNEPIGEAKGIFPGRVVWIHNPDATNENCNPRVYGNSYFNTGNSDQSVIDAMVSTAIRNLTGTENDKDAWSSIFKFHNNTRGKGEVDYTPGEKIFIKINATSAWFGNYSTSTLAVSNNFSFGISETSPQIIISVLRQLVNVVEVAQSDIYIGDPMKHIYKHSYDLWHAEFPDVHYLDHDSHYTNLGREGATASTTAIIDYSDDGSVLRAGSFSEANSGSPVYQDYLYKIFEDAEYMINVPMLKGHRRAGVTMFAKNHFGSHTREDATQLHMGLVAPNEFPDTMRTGYNLYRIQVDLMGHELLGGKNLFYLMDALWATDHELDIPLKWETAPFNNDFMSSVFASFDPVAIESVGYDFLRSEFTNFVQMRGTDDYLHQAADSSNWPEGIVYQPSGERLGSLGVHEHWNNPSEMKYSRNLGTGEGIELLKATTVSVENINQDVPSDFVLYQNYPNPFNPVTTIEFSLKEESNIMITIYDIAGKLVDVIADNEYKPAGTYQIRYNAENMASGIYFLHLNAGGYSRSIKMILMK